MSYPQLWMKIKKKIGIKNTINESKNKVHLSINVLPKYLPTHIGTAITRPRVMKVS